MVPGCANHHPMANGRIEGTAPPTWSLIVAPFTREFPGGDMAAPLSQWSLVRTFDNEQGCDGILTQAQDNLQRPVLCIASDDPRLKQTAPAAESKN